jgi:hypothetical protein
VAAAVGLAYELCERLSDRLLMGTVNLDLFPDSGAPLSAHSVEQPVDFRCRAVTGKAIRRRGCSSTCTRRQDQALAVYWKMQPLIELIYDVQASLLRRTRGST